VADDTDSDIARDPDGGTDSATDPSHGRRPLTARSVVASTLLGTDPPRLPVGFLVRTGALFGLAEGTVRTALSRMSAAGEVVRDGDGWYALGGELVDRQARQRRSRRAATVEWSGRWRMAVVAGGGRSAGDRAELRRAMRSLRMAELRDGVWLRPDNLDRTDPTWRSDVVDRQCQWFQVEPQLSLDHGDAELAATLWDLAAWADHAVSLRREMHQLIGRLGAGDTEALAPGFVLSAAVLRHFVADPLLPRELLPRRWPGEALRADYDRYDAAYRGVLAHWYDVGRGEVAGADAAATVDLRERS
jgi:phenylacetic acid degradation operon negative regulatory protein